MIDWFHHLHVVWMTAVVCAAAAIATGAIHFIVFAFAKGARVQAFKAMTPVMLTPLAVVFALLVGFLAAEVWRNVDRANTAVAQEASALNTVVLLASNLPRQSEAQVLEHVRRHIEGAIDTEWPAMDAQRTTLDMMSMVDNEALRLILSMSVEDEEQRIVQRELISALESALEARRERIIISHTSISGVKWAVVLVLGGLILLTIAIVHGDNRLTAAIAMAIFAVGLVSCVVLIASHDRPFTGEKSIGPDLLLQAMPESG